MSIKIKTVVIFHFKPYYIQESFPKDFQSLDGIKDIKIYTFTLEPSQHDHLIKTPTIQKAMLKCKKM